MSRFLKLAGFLLVSFCLLIYVLRDVALTELADQFRRANYGWLVPVALVQLLVHVIRAARWQLALRPAGYRPSVLHTTLAITSGTILSVVIPGGGELARCGVLSRTDGVPTPVGIGSVVAERVADMLVLALAIALTFWLEYTRLHAYIPIYSQRQRALQIPGLERWIGFALLVATAVVGWWLWLGRHSENAFILRFRRLGGQMKQGFLSVARLPGPWLYIGYSLLLYFLYFLATYLTFFALPQADRLSPQAAFTIVTLGAIGGLAVPTQGSVGTYHVVAQWVLTLYGFQAAEGAVIATFLHAVLVGLSLFWCLPGFWLVSLVSPRRTAS